MDIKSVINNQLLLPANKLTESAFNLKVGQQLEVKAVSANIQVAKNMITLSLGNCDITVQSNQPIKLNPVQILTIQLTKITPVTEFKILTASPELKNLTADLRLTILTTDGVASDRKPMQPPSTVIGGVQDNTNVKQPLTAKIISLIGNKIQLQITSSTPALITIERTQLSNLPTDLQVGQHLKLEIVKTGTTPEFRFIPTSSVISEAKVANFIKQFLPRHQTSPIFLNQLIKDLPQLLNNTSIPEALKNLAEKIIQNLPDQEQLISSSRLKQAIADSGLFLEATLPAQTELIKNDRVPVSLQRIAAEIVQNLLPKTLLPEAPKPLPEIVVLQQPAGTLGTEDFKANLLKFIQLLKHELSRPNEQHDQTDLDLLKSLQNKTENTIAKITLDQLMSLPKDDNPKQLWIIDLPFMNRQQAETVKIEIQQDHIHKRQTGSSNWSVNITLSPPDLGTIHCVVSYRDGLIHTFFDSQNTQTIQLIKHNLNTLKNQLEASGLAAGQMDAHDSAQKKSVLQQLAGKKLFDDLA
jgi:hypothetical protein